MAYFLDEYERIMNEVISFVPEDCANNVRKLNYSDLSLIENYISENRNIQSGYSIDNIYFAKEDTHEKEWYSFRGTQRNVLSIDDNSEREGMSFILSRDY